MEPLLDHANSFQTASPGMRTAVACASIGLVLLSGGLISGCRQTYGPDVVAVVNKQPIQRAEVEKYYRDNLGNNKEQPSREQATLRGWGSCGS